MDVNKVGVALIGAGVWGETHAKAYSQNPNARFYAVCDLNEERARALAEKYGAEKVFTDFEEMLDDPAVDAVGVATPDYAHEAPVVAALQRGKHVLVEKPLATTVDACNRMIAAAKASRGHLMVDFHSRWVAPFAGAKQIVEANEIGTPVHGFIRLSDTIYVPRDMLQWSSKSTVLWFLACHCVDILRWTMNAEVTRVYGQSRRRALREEHGVDTPDFYLTTLEFDNGAVIVMENSWVMQDGEPVIFDYRMELYGSQGSVKVNAAHNGALVKVTPQKVNHLDTLFGTAVHGKFIGGAVEAIHYFIDHVVVKNEEPMVTGEDGLRATQVLAAIEKSVETGQPVELQY